jgi:hypothetical protein
MDKTDVTIGRVRMTRLAAEVLQAVGLTDPDVERDVCALESGKATEAALLATCLDGADAADASTRDGWREYVAAVALEAAKGE